MRIGRIIALFTVQGRRERPRRLCSQAGAWERGNSHSGSRDGGITWTPEVEGLSARPGSLRVTDFFKLSWGVKQSGSFAAGFVIAPGGHDPPSIGQGASLSCRLKAGPSFGFFGGVLGGASRTSAGGGSAAAAFSSVVTSYGFWRQSVCAGGKWTPFSYGAGVLLDG